MKGCWQHVWKKSGELIPDEFLRSPELHRRARLIGRFSILGSLFGFTYSGFYFAIGHLWGVLITLLCSSAVALIPLVLLRTRSLSLAGNLMAFVLTAGFTGLCGVEGGLHGHAIAWLVSIPLCALLLVGKSSAKGWVAVCVLAAGAFATLALLGIRVPTTYPPEWASLISAAGYLGLILFMFILGMVFETGRETAFSRMSAALAELSKSNERLLHLNNEKNEFLGIAAHDLKNPLTAIIGSAELITLTRDPKRVEQGARMILRSGIRMRDLISSLLDANAIEEGRFTSKLEPLDLRQLVAESVEHNRDSAARKSIQIAFPEGTPAWATADRGATVQILDNLVSNAVKYSPGGTTVHLATRLEAGCAWVDVRDEGPGISEADQQKLFRKFTRLSAKPTGGESSTGLGLSIVKRLAEAMAGGVDCQSTLGSGTTFRVRLPSCAPPSSDSTHAQAA